MKFKGFSLYIPSSNAQKESVHLRLTLPKIVGLSFLILPLAIFVITSVGEVWSAVVLEYRLGISSAKRQIQLSRLKKMQKKSNAYHDAIQYVIETDRVCRISYGMKPIDGGSLQVGIGGRLLPSMEAVESESDRDIISALRLDERFDFYSRQAKLIETSLDRVEKRVSNERVRLLETPSIYPSSGTLSSTFGSRFHPVLGYTARHEGLDFSGRSWSPIIAAADGIVVTAEYDGGGYGNLVEIRHPSSGYRTRYAHLAGFNVSAGDVVKRGEQIGSMGNTGRSTGTHLHYEVLQNGVPVDPEGYLLGKLRLVSK